ncbi:hypothetical protein LUZ63_018420 [Rhynchospora breviuscula]|uniref:Uncharacterized protein n=1 Tax=Rhynchospora breviuscula TaxID=2022672 RepID=A0A9Q0HIP0_9POAL|nr:hypothetical protein LUZ63_018420 [Rhynchospora breviuscula]
MSTTKQPPTSASPPRLGIIFFSLPAPGHVIPMVDMAKIFTKHGAECALILTPLNTARFESTINHSGLRLITFKFPSEIGLLAGCESSDVLPSRNHLGLFGKAIDLLEQPFRELLRAHNPDAVFYDAMLPWTAIASAKLNIPCYLCPGIGKPIFHVGPVCLGGISKEDVAEWGRGKELAAESERLLRWLDGRPAHSVVYVSFGSLSWLPKAQLREIGFGLIDSGVPFIWSVGGGGDGSDEVVDEVAAAAPETGQVITGWAPQFAMLGHVAVGTFLTHCGWGAVTEAAAVRKLMLTWPLCSDEFYNEKLVVQVAGIGGRWAQRRDMYGERRREPGAQRLSSNYPKIFLKLESFC